MSEQHNERLYCRELAFRGDPLFRMSHVFAGRQFSDRLIALYALFSAIGEICSAVSDENVARQKLSWWRNEVGAIQRGAGTHPVSAELQRSGAAGDMPAGLLGKFLDSAETRLNVPSVADQVSLQSLCLDTGLPMLLLELSVCGVSLADNSALEGAASRRGLYRLMHGSLGAIHWWVPLDLLARHGLSRAEYAEPGRAGAAASLNRDLFGWGAFMQAADLGDLTDISDTKYRIRHLFAYDSLVKKKIKYANNSSYDLDGKLWKRTGIGDLLTCWRAARRVNLLK